MRKAAQIIPQTNVVIYDFIAAFPLMLILELLTESLFIDRTEGAERGLAEGMTCDLETVFSTNTCLSDMLPVGNPRS